jgi:hypothetical protein
MPAAILGPAIAMDAIRNVFFARFFTRVTPPCVGLPSVLTALVAESTKKPTRSTPKGWVRFGQRLLKNSAFPAANGLAPWESPKSG